MRYILKAFCVTLLLVLTGCASQPQYPISLANTSLSESSKVAVVMTEVPAAKMTYPGASCLLCLAAAATANSALSTHTKTLSTDDISSINLVIKDALSTQNVSAQIVDTPIVFKDLKKLKKSKEGNTPKYDLSAYKASHDATHVAVVAINFVGVERNYASYIPKGVPQILISGETYMVDLSTNTYSLYQPIKIYRAADGQWKEPSEYPNLTNAYYQAVEDARDNIKKHYGIIGSTGQ